MGPPGICGDPLIVNVLTVNNTATIGTTGNCSDTLDVCATTDFYCLVEFYDDCVTPVLTASIDSASGKIYTSSDLEVHGAAIDLGDSCGDQLTVNADADFICDLDVGSGQFHVSASDGSLDIGPGIFTINGTSGNTVTQGTLSVVLSAAIGTDLQVGDNTSLGNACTDTLDVCATTDFKCDVEFYDDCSETTLVASVTAATGNIWTLGDLAVDGGDMTSAAATFNLLDVTPGTINFGGGATTIDIGSGTCTTTVNNDLVVTNDANVQNNLDVDVDANVDGNLVVDGNTTLGDSCGDTLSVVSTSRFDCDIAVYDTVGTANRLTIDSTTGNTWIDGTLDVEGDFDVGSGNFTVTAASGNTVTQGTLTAVGQIIGTGGLDLEGFDVADDSGNTVITGTLQVDGNTQLGNSCGADTLTVDAVTYLNCDLDIGSAATAEFYVTASDGSLNIGPNLFTVAGASGNTIIQGTLGVTGLGTFSSGITINAGGLTINAGGANITGASTLSGNLSMGANNLNITGDIASGGARVNKGWFEDIDVNDLIVNTSTSFPAASIAGAAISDDSLDFTEFVAAMTVDEATTIATAAGLTIGGFDMSGAFIFEAPIAFADGATNPSVAGGNVFSTANTGATSITTFTNGTTGQVIVIVFTDALTTVDELTNIRLSAAFTSTADDTMTLVYDGANWYEVSRSVN